MNNDADAKASGREAVRGREDAVDAMARLLDRPLSDADLLSNTDRVASPISAARRRGAGALVFSLGAERLAIPAPDVARVLGVVGTHRIPHRTNDIVRGLCNVDGELVLCGDLARLLDMPSAEDSAAKKDATGDTRRTVVLGASRSRWAFIAGEVHGVVETDPDDRQAPPLTLEGAFSRFTDSLLMIDSTPVALLDSDRVLSGFEAALK